MKQRIGSDSSVLCHHGSFEDCGWHSFLLPVPLCFDTRGCLHASGMRDTGVERNGVLRSLNLQ